MDNLRHQFPNNIIMPKHTALFPEFARGRILRAMSSLPQCALLGCTRLYLTLLLQSLRLFHLPALLPCHLKQGKPNFFARETFLNGRLDEVILCQLQIAWAYSISTTD